MKKDEFLSQLEYLLQDIPEEDKRDAIDYYRDYLEEAGPEREEDVLREFGSPERIASMIRVDLMGGMEQGGEFTDRGYTDERFGDNSCPPAVGKTGWTRSEASGGEAEWTRPEASGGETEWTRPEASVGETGWKGNDASGQRAEWRHSAPRGNWAGKKGAKKSARAAERAADGEKKPTWIYVLVGLGVLILAPVILSLAFGAVGSVFGAVLTLLAMLLVLGLLTVAAFLGGISLVILGFSQMFGSFWIGLMFVGLGMASVGGGLLLFHCCFLFYGKFLPWLCRWVVQFIKRVGDWLAQKIGGGCV